MTIVATIMTWAPVAVTACSIITAAFPRPENKVLGPIWGVLNVIACNFGHAKNTADAVKE